MGYWHTGILPLGSKVVQDGKDLTGKNQMLPFTIARAGVSQMLLLINHDYKLNTFETKIYGPWLFPVFLSVTYYLLILTNT